MGAAVGEAVLGRRIGGKAALIGGLCATLPDLDSFIPYADAVATMTYHRGFSHSLIVLTLFAPVLAFVLCRLFRKWQVEFRSWWLMTFLVLVTHPLLDAFTVYGTQLLWPVWEYPVSWSTVFIIDPAYTLPLSIGVVAALFLRRESRARRLFNTGGLALSSLYLAWTVGAKFALETRMREALDAQQISYTGMLSTPSPFNSILWRFVIMDERGYYEGWASVLDDRTRWTHFGDEKQVLADTGDIWAVQRLQWFTHGFYSVRTEGEELVMADLRMGIEPAYPFTFSVANRENGRWLAHPARQMGTSWDARRVEGILANGLRTPP